MHASSDGEMVTKLPEVTAELQREELRRCAVTGRSPAPGPPYMCAQARPLCRPIEWILVDGMRGGSGKPYNYSKVKVPKGRAEKGWILAGGLNADNVTQAVRALQPDVVDVSSGVAVSPKVLLKDPARIARFMQAVQAAAQ